MSAAAQQAAVLAATAAVPWSIVYEGDGSFRMLRVLFESGGGAGGGAADYWTALAGGDPVAMNVVASDMRGVWWGRCTSVMDAYTELNPHLDTNPIDLAWMLSSLMQCDGFQAIPLAARTLTDEALLAHATVHIEAAAAGDDLDAAFGRDDDDDDDDGGVGGGGGEGKLLRVVLPSASVEIRFELALRPLAAYEGAFPPRAGMLSTERPASLYIREQVLVPSLKLLADMEAFRAAAVARVNVTGGGSGDGSAAAALAGAFNAVTSAQEHGPSAKGLVAGQRLSWPYNAVTQIAVRQWRAVDVSVKPAAPARRSKAAKKKQTARASASASAASASPLSSSASSSQTAAAAALRKRKGKAKVGASPATLSGTKRGRSKRAEASRGDSDADADAEEEQSVADVSAIDLAGLLAAVEDTPADLQRRADEIAERKRKEDAKKQRGLVMPAVGAGGLGSGVAPPATAAAAAAGAAADGGGEGSASPVKAAAKKKKKKRKTFV